MEAHSARPLTNVCKLAIIEIIIKHTEINFESMLSITYVKEMQNLHTQHSLIRVHLELYSSVA